MPLPNGVDPWGAIHTTCPAAGFLGNRGILHNEDGVITRQWKNKSWVTCSLHYRGRDRKPLMQPGRYSELFFLDEATALAAGHRPCGECRTVDYVRFRTAWQAAQGNGSVAASIVAIDQALHTDRVTATKDKNTYESRLSQLPLGAMFEADGNAYLCWTKGHLQWSPTGYQVPATKFPVTMSVKVLTPLSIVAVFTAGYVPQVHESAGGECERMFHRA